MRWNVHKALGWKKKSERPSKIRNIGKYNNNTVSDENHEYLLPRAVQTLVI